MPPDLTASEVAALRQTGVSPLRPTDPRRVGPYVPVALLGSGGMGRVYLARPADDSPGLVAVKVIRPEYADDAQFRRRFEHEASVHAQVRTPYTPRLCGTGFQHELLWMATEYLPGLDLADAVREDGALGTAAVWRLVAELGRALADLAATGIVHRDLKPSNVLLSVRGAHVIDFGISKAADASAITGTGNRVGTPAYMSPEHLRTGLSDTASDVFSLAGTLVYAATGSAPFGDGTGVDVMHRVAFEEPNPELIGEISAADAVLGALLSACLAKEPEQRPTPQDLTDAAAAQARAHTGTHASTSSWPEPLGGRVLARQRAYEVLHRLPVERMAHPRPSPPPQPSPSPSPSDERPKAEPPPQPQPQPQQVGRSAQPGLEPPVEAAGPSAVTPPARSRPAGARSWRSWTRKKPVLAVTAGITVCAVAAGVFVLTRPDTPASASSPGAGGTSAAGTTPGDDALPPAPGTSEETSLPEASGKSPDGGARPGDDTSSPDVSGSADDGRQGDPATPAAKTSAPTDPTQSPSDDPPPPESATPPWISDCTHYSGNGRTREGDSGKRVLQLQCMLTKRGYGVGDSGADGNFGPGTASAVRSFQSDKGLNADGIVARETWTALRASD
ncbi:protein kinase [Streptomyces sp. NPDC050704]|uniref:protein kinase domain-containing protein n=1 Tax=Streptomyces sp. NPDC050704 TaxID=3157219 RepID=UPI003449D3B7